MSINNSNTCPACGYRIEFAPWKGDQPSFEYCPCCGIQFGYHDFAKGDWVLRRKTWDEWRKKWVANGMKWSGTWRGKLNNPPEDWNPKEQLENAGLLES